MKSCWGTLKNDVLKLFNEFHVNACLPKIIPSCFLALVPKIEIPQVIGDFRPISLMGWLYKFIAKVLASRLGQVMESVISSNQSAFIKKRHIADGVVVINEVIDLAKKRGKECVIL